MNARIALLATLVFVASVVFAPSSVAQTSPKFEVTATWAMNMPTHTLKKDGRDNMEITVIAKAQDFICAGTFEYSVVVAVEGSFEQWAGSSVEKDLVTLTWEAQEPGNNPGKTKTWEGKTRLNIAWDLETAPRQGAKQVYKVKPQEYKKGINGKTGPCIQEPPVPSLISSPEMVVSLPDRLEANGTEEEPCDQNPDQLKCKTSVPPAEDSPAPGVMILVGALGLVAYLRRRQQN